MMISPVVPSQPANDHDELELLKAEEVAEILKCDPSTVYKLIRTKKLWSVRIGKLVRVQRRQLNLFIDQHHHI